MPGVDLTEANFIVIIVYLRFRESQRIFSESCFFVEFLEEPIRHVLETVKQMFPTIHVFVIPTNHHIIVFVKQIFTLTTNQIILTRDTVSTDTNNVISFHRENSLPAV